MNTLLQYLSTYFWFIAIPLLFLIIVLYVFRPGARRRYQKDAEIPFREEDDEH